MAPWLLVGAGLAQDPPAAGSRRAALEQAAKAPWPTSRPEVDGAASLGTQTGPLRLVELSLDVMAAAGTSTERDSVLGDLKGGAHDPRKRGFTLQQAELSIAGAVDPWFQAKMYLITSLDPDEGETVVELEEAYLTTSQLPADLQVKAGTYFTEFGRINPTHPHGWDWQDQPVIHTRVFGGDGMRGPGARVSWLLPTAQYGELFLGVQNANGETMASFLANEEVYEERPVGGRQFSEREVRSAGDLVWSLRAATSYDLSDTSSLGLGASALFGPNATGGDGETMVYGADFVFRWRPVENRRGYPFVKLQGEFVARAFETAEQTDASDPLDPVVLPGETLDDQGGYLQGLYGFAEGLAAGVRVDLATGSGDSYQGGGAFGRDADPFRTDRLRVSPLLVWQPSEFSRVRLQYDFDDSDHLDDEVHSVWLGFEVLIGSHPPHSH